MIFLCSADPTESKRCSASIRPTRSASSSGMARAVEASDEPESLARQLMQSLAVSVLPAPDSPEMRIA